MQLQIAFVKGRSLLSPLPLVRPQLSRPHQGKWKEPGTPLAPVKELIRRIQRRKKNEVKEI